jgi:hypothetical protein
VKHNFKGLAEKVADAIEIDPIDDNVRLFCCNDLNDSALRFFKKVICPSPPDLYVWFKTQEERLFALLLVDEIFKDKKSRKQFLLCRNLE